MRTFGMWLLAGVCALAGWDAFERMNEADPSAPQPPQESMARSMEDGTPAPPPPLAAPASLE